MLIENHRTILNVRRNRTERELNAVLVRLLEKEGTHGLAPGIQAPRATFNAIFLIRHAAVHFQKEGIVLRHLCDWACFLTRHWDEIDHALFRTAMEDYRMDRFADLMTAAAVEYLGAEVPGPECEAGMLGRFMEEVLTLSPMPDKPLPRLLRKLSGPYRNRWRLREVLRTPVWSWPRKDKNSHDPGKSFAGYFGFKNKELYLHRKTTQGIRYLVRIGKK